MTALAAIPVVPKRAARSSGTGVGQVSISSSCGAFTTSSGSFVDVTNLSVSITTQGGPVSVGLIADGAAESQIFGNMSAVVRFVRTSTAIGDYDVGSGSGTTVVPGSSAHIIDAPASGTYTYKVQLKLGSGTQAGILRSKLVVYEL